MELMDYINDVYRRYHQVLQVFRTTTSHNVDLIIMNNPCRDGAHSAPSRQGYVSVASDLRIRTNEEFCVMCLAVRIS